MKIRLWGVSVVAVSLLAFSGCAKNASRAGIDPKPEVKAPTKITQSFVVVSDADATGPTGTSGPTGASGPTGVSGPTGTASAPAADPTIFPQDQAYVGIKKAALEKEFLLSASMIPQTGAATSQGLAGRIVAFRHIGDKVYMLEATQGHVVTTDLPATLILAEIPVIRETDDMLVLDFNKGMQSVFTAGNWYGSDDAGTDFQPQIQAEPVNHSFLESVAMQDNLLEIRQIAQLIDNSDPKTTSYPTVEVRYFIQPYAPNPNFVPKDSGDFKHIGFFEVAPQLELNTGRNIVRTSRWDLSGGKTITYAVSANTPADYVDAVKEGALYWNQAFGREVVKVIMAPAGVTAPDPKYNVIQWVPNDNAGFAYADALMDPRSGEILHAQVYLTSVFATSSKDRMAMLLRRLRDEENAPAKRQFGLSILPTGRLCDYAFDHHMVDSLQALVDVGADDATYLRVSQDYVREVVAHEVGHTLGLRHNFAGSYGTDFTQQARDDVYSKYVRTGQVVKPGRATSSVMEYEVWEDSVITGSQMKAELPALSYDQMAIDWGYADKSYDPKTAPLFCTDSQTATYTDCQTFDSGRSPLEYLSYSNQMTLSRLPMSLAETFIRAKVPYDPRDTVPFDQVALDPLSTAKTLAGNLASEVSWLGDQAPRSLYVERQFPFVSSMDQDDVNAKESDWVQSQVKDLGGIEGILFNLLPEDGRDTPTLAKTATDQLAAYLARSDVRDGIGWDGKPYSLTGSEIQFIQDTGAKYFAKVENDLLDLSFDALAKGKYANTPVGAEIEKKLGKVATAVVLTQDSDGTTFKYTLQTRLKAAKLLSGDLGVPQDWSLDARDSVTTKLKDLVEKALSQKVDSIDMTKLTRTQREWYLEQKAILTLLTNM